MRIDFGAKLESRTVNKQKGGKDVLHPPHLHVITPALSQDGIRGKHVYFSMCVCVCVWTAALCSVCSL